MPSFQMRKQSQKGQGIAPILHAKMAKASVELWYAEVLLSVGHWVEDGYKDGGDKAFSGKGSKPSREEPSGVFSRYISMCYQNFLITPCVEGGARMIWRPGNMGGGGKGK